MVVQCPICRYSAKEIEITEVEVLTESMNIVIECSCSECDYKFNVRRKYKCKYIGIEYLEE